MSYFTVKEVEIMELLGQGLTVVEIAKKLRKAKTTVECQIMNLRKRHKAINLVHLYTIYVNLIPYPIKKENYEHTNDI